MQRIKEEFIDKLLESVTLSGGEVLEIGCGEGRLSVQIAEQCKSLVALDPSEELIQKAQDNNPRDNIRYVLGSAERLPFQPESFDVSVFTLSLHHVPKDAMTKAIDEAIRVTRKNGFIVFLEPEFNGDFFQAETYFDTYDGDERKVKAAAYLTMLSHDGIKEVKEFFDETVFRFDSTKDFMDTMMPKQNLDQLDGFLREHRYTLTLGRRINIFQPKNRLN